MEQLESQGASLQVTEPVPARLIVALSGDYDIASIARLQPEIDALLSREALSVAVDLGGLNFMDSSGVAILLRIANRFGPLEVENASPMICRMIQGLGLSEVLRMPPA